MASLLSSPNGELIQTVVSMVLPFPIKLESRLQFDAIILAAMAKRQNEFGVASFLSLAGVILVALLNSSERGSIGR